MLKAITKDPLLKQLLHYVVRDEARHVTFGINYLTEFVTTLCDEEGLDRAQFALEACTVSRNRLKAYDVWEKYGMDLVQRARSGKMDPVIGRDDEIRRVIRILSRKTKNNPVLIGEPGVGKTAIVEGLAQRIVRGDVPEGLKDRKVFSLDMGCLLYTSPSPRDRG